MRQIIERLQGRITHFIAQREDVALVVRCTEPDAAIVAKILEGLDESSPSELYWTVTAAFEDAETFAASCVQTFAVTHEAVRLAMEQKQLAPWPPLPPQIREAGALRPIERLRALITFSRSLLPTLEGTGVIWALLPFQINNGPGWAAFAAALWQHDFPFPWCHHVRLILRDTFESPLLEPYAATAPRVARAAVDLSIGAIQRGLEEEAGDETVPLDQRVNACLMLAGMDFGHADYDRAIQKYDVVHRFAAASQNPTLAVVALNGMADVLRAQGKPDHAAFLLHTAIAPAALAPAPPVPVLQDIYTKLGAHHLARRECAEAEVFLQGAADLSYVLRDPDQRLRSLKALGEAQYRQENVLAALKNWLAGAVVAGKLEKWPEHEEFIAYLRSHYMNVGDEQGLAAVLGRVQQEIATHREEAASLESTSRGV